MADITYNNPLVTESKLTEFYNDIKPFLGCPAYVTQEGDAEYYSTDEKVIGRWVDDKPLYQKTLFISNSYTSEVVVPNTGTGISVNGVTDVFISDIKPTLDKIINIQMNTNNRSYNGSSFHHSYPFRFNKDNGYVATVDNYNVGYQENIALYPGTSFTFKYTKSTDSASTTIEQKSTHYSTEEQIVGTWIDGRPIYQKTLYYSLPVTTARTYRKITSIDNLDFIVFTTGFCDEAGVTTIKTIPLSDAGGGAGIDIACHYPSTNDVSMIVTNIGSGGNSPCYITIQYTKTTD